MYLLLPSAPGFVVPGQVPPTQPAMYQSAGYPEDPGREEVKNFEFSNKSIRAGFIRSISLVYFSYALTQKTRSINLFSRKVYSILMCQLLITLGLITLFMYHEKTRLWVKQNPSLVWISLIATFVLLICMVCCTSVRRTAPMNFIFLFLFTGAQGFVLATISSAYTRDEVSRIRVQIAINDMN